MHINKLDIESPDKVALEVVSYKYIVDTNNAECFDLSEISLKDLPIYSEVLVDNNTNKAYGIVIIRENEARQGAFLTTDRTPIDLSNVLQLEIESFDIPKFWINECYLKEIFSSIQTYIRYFLKGQNVILWFHYGQYYMYPISHFIEEKEYQYFPEYMKRIFMGFLNDNKCQVNEDSPNQN